MPARDLHAQTKPRVEVTTETQDGFVRLHFSFDRPQQSYSVSSQQRTVIVRFDDAHEIELIAAVPDAYGIVHAARSDPDKKGVRFATSAQVEVRDHVYANHLLVDLLPQGWVGPPPPPSPALIRELAKRATANSLDAHERAQAKKGVSDDTSIVEANIADASLTQGAASIDESDLGEASHVATEPPTPSPSPAAASHLPISFEKAISHSLHAGNSQGEDRTALAPPVERGEGVESPSTFRLALGIEVQEPLAAFQRGKRVHIVAPRRSMDLEMFVAEKLLHIQDEAGGLIEAITCAGIDATYDSLLIDFDRPRTLGLEEERGQWILTVGGDERRVEGSRAAESLRSGDQVLLPVSDDRVVLPVTGGGPVVVYHDVSIDERLFVVPETQRAMPRPGWRRVDFDILPSLHGLVVRPKRTDLEVAVGPAYAEVSRKGGLIHSQQTSGDPRLLNQATLALFTPQDAGIRSLPFVQAVHESMHAVGDFGSDVSLGKCVDFARVYLHAGFFVEAASLLELGETEGHVCAADPDALALGFIARVANRNSERAFGMLEEHPSLRFDPRLAPWRMQLEIRRGAGAGTTKVPDNFIRSLSAIPPALQSSLLFDAIELALGASELDLAQSLRLALGRITLDGSDRDRLDLLDARYLMGTGDLDKARQALARAEKSRHFAVRTHARLLRLLEALEGGDAPHLSIAQALYSLSYSWRGRPYDYPALKTASELYIQHKDYRNAFASARDFATAYPGDEEALRLVEEASSLFVALMSGEALGEQVPDAISRVSLFFDFSDFIPLGSKGDAIIRVLSGELAGLGLYEHAIALLRYQIDERLSEPQRPFVRSALVRLLLDAQRPAEALSELNAVGGAFLPEQMKERHTKYKAEAMIDLGRSEAALALLAMMTDEGAYRLRLAAYAQGGHWSDLAQEIERNLDERWRDGSSLSADQSVDVLRAALAYARIGDGLALQRLTTRWGDLMAQSEEADAFRVATDWVEHRADSVEGLARTLARSDLFSRYFESLRDMEEEEGV